MIIIKKKLEKFIKIKKYMIYVNFLIKAKNQVHEINEYNLDQNNLKKLVLLGDKSVQYNKTVKK